MPEDGRDNGGFVARDGLHRAKGVGWMGEEERVETWEE